MPILRLEDADPIAATYRAFLSDIVANPADDVPRLILADWLEDHDRSKQAEFIRTQIEANRLSCKPDSETGHFDRNRTTLECNCCWCVLVQKAGRMLNAGLPNPGWLWAGRPLNDPHLFPRVQLTYYRGFVGGVRIRMKDWMEYGPEIVASQPVTIVNVQDKHPAGSEAQPFWRNTVGLDSGLPADIFAAMDRLDTKGDEHVTHPAERMMTRLSRACVAWARELAKLPLVL